MVEEVEEEDVPSSVSPLPACPLMQQHAAARGHGGMERRGRGYLKRVLWQLASALGGLQHGLRHHTRAVPHAGDAPRTLP